MENGVLMEIKLILDIISKQLRLYFLEINYQAENMYVKINLLCK